ncbi:MAG TPA: elongation factor Ts [Lachnospiraceae bacterium]|nr:elongation factor Ts [Lachnospiraceae bacterium]
MAITAKQVKELRELTGSGMMDCKKALTETDGDMDKAVEWLREKGKASAEKKASRIAAEGLVMVKVAEDGKKGVAVEVNSETDFVAKNELFREFVSEVADQAMDSSAADMDAFLAEPWKLDASKTVKDIQTEKVAVIGENLNIRRFETVEAADGVVVDYTHMGGKIGVLVQVKSDVVNDAIVEMGKNVAMQIAAMRPKYTSRSEVPADYIEKEEQILLAAIMNDPKESQKPEKVIKGIVKGRVNKEMKEIVLLDQVYVKAEDGKQTVAKYVEEVGKANGAKTSVVGFLRYETGEGLEKKNEDFAAEVAAQMNK